MTMNREIMECDDDVARTDVHATASRDDGGGGGGGRQRRRRRRRRGDVRHALPFLLLLVLLSSSSSSYSSYCSSYSYYSVGASSPYVVTWSGGPEDRYFCGTSYDDASIACAARQNCRSGRDERPFSRRELRPPPLLHLGRWVPRGGQHQQPA